MIIKNIFNRYLALAMTLVFTSAAVWAAPGDVISFNFHQDDSGNKGPVVGDQVTLEGTVPAEHWNSNKKNLASGNWQNGSNSKTLVYNVNSNVGSESSATCAWTFSAAHFYGGAAGNYSDENYFMKCIAAPQAGGSGTETLTISNIPFTKYYAVIYISNWDIGHNTSFKLGETNYSVSATGLAIPDSTENWGGTATSPVYGTNAVKVENLSGDFSFSMTSAKCNVCAIQIVDDTAAKVGDEVIWSNLDSDAAKATHYTRNNATLSLPDSTIYPIGTKIKINSIKFFNNSSKDMRSSMTLNEVTSDQVVTESRETVTSGSYTFNQMFIFNFTTTPLIVDIGESYTITGSGNTGLQYPGIQTDGVIDIGVGGYKALCAVEGEVYAPAGYRVEIEENEVALSTDTPVKVFSGINSLAMLKSRFEAGEVSAMIGGEWLDPAKNIEAFVLDTETDTTLSYQFQVDDDNYLKMVVVEFTVGADGIYAKQTAQGNVSGKGAELLGQKVFTSGGDYTFSGVGVANYTITSIAAPAVVKAAGDDKVEVEFTPANDEDWADLILPTKAKGVAVAGNMSFASRSAYKQTLGEREATVALVTDAQDGNLIYGLHAFSVAGLGPINRDIYLMMTGGTAGVLSGGEDATYNATKTVLTGNTLLNLKGEATVDYIYGAGLGGGNTVTTTGDIGVVVEEDAQVKGSIVAGWQSRHNSVPKVVGNTSVLVKNVQTNYQSASITSGNFSCSQGWIVGGGLHWGNGGRSTIQGNTHITLDIPSDKSGEFMKHITAGGHAEGGGDGNNVTGHSSVVITAPDTVTFSKNIIGGGHSTGSNKAKVSGNSSVTINGGTYTGTIYAAGDNGEHTLVSGTATLTITGGNFDGATLKGGIATGTKTLNVRGTTSKLNVSGFDNVTISSAAKLALTDTVQGNLTITRNTTVYFPENWEDNTPYTLCSGTLTRDTTSTGTLTLESQQVHVGERVIPADIVFDFDNKTIKYVVLEKTSVYTFSGTEQSLIVIDAADGGVCTLDYTGDKFFSEDCVFSGLPEGYMMWVEGGTIVKVVKKTDSFSLKVGTRTTNKNSAIHEDDESVGGFPVYGKFWNNTPVWNENNTATNILMTLKSGMNVDTDGVKAYIHMPNTWYSSANDNGTGNERLTATYADDGQVAADTQWTIGEGEDEVTLPAAPCARGWQIRVTNIPYEVYDLYIYVASDVGTVGNSALKATAMALSVNGGTDWKWYAGDPAHNATIAAAQSNTWKADPYSTGTLTEGANYIKIRVSAAAFGQDDVSTLDITHGPRNTGSSTRSSLAGIQIVKVDDDGIYNREADEEGKDAWTAEGMWTRSNGDVVTTWPTEGTILAKIDGDKTAEIKIDGVINATMVTLTNTAAADGDEAKSFKFLTNEPLDEVDQDKEPEEFVLKSPVDATGFHGNLFLQSRIRGRIALGDDTNIKFVAGEEGVDDETNRAIVTTAFPYEFSGSNNPITKVGFGTFIVPSSMYERSFHFEEGNIKYAAEGTISGTITGSKPVIIDAGENVVTVTGSIQTDVIVRSGTLRLGKTNPFVGSADHQVAVTVEAGATLDLNGYTLDAANVTINIEGEGVEGHPYALMNGSSSGATISSFVLTGNATIGGTGNITINSGSHALDIGEYKLTKAGSGLMITTSITVSGTAGIDVVEGGYRVDQWNNHLPEGTLHVYEGAYFQHNNDRAYEVKNVILDEGAEIRGATTVRYLKISGELNIPDTTELNHYIMLNGAAIKGSGTLKLVEGGTLVVGAETTSTAALMLTQAGTLTLNAAISFPTIKLAADYSAAEIDEIANLSFDTLTLENGATLDMTEKLRYPYYTLGATQNGKIKITTPTCRKRIVEVADGYTSGITLVDAEGETLPSCVMDGYLYYGTLFEGTEVAKDSISATVVYPSTTTVTGYDSDTEYLVSDGMGGVAVATKTDSISINFGVISETEGKVDISDTEVGACPVSGASWNNALDTIKDGNGNTLSMTASINDTIFYGASTNVVAQNTQLNGNEKLTYSYLGNGEGKTWSITIHDIPYNKFDLYLIAANNSTEDLTALPYQIKADGSSDYYGSSIAGTIDSTWTVKPYAIGGNLVPDANYIKVSIKKKVTDLTIQHPYGGEGVTTLAAIQIVEDKSEDDGIYIRRSDDELDAEGIAKTWTAANSWLDSDGNPKTWTGTGSHIVSIDASTVSEITVNDKIAADSVTVTGTAGVNGFKFLTEEPLDEVADVKEDAPFRLDAPVSLIDFHGDVYLQSRITGQIQLGEHAHIVFVAGLPTDEKPDGDPDEETTAYQYSFNGTIQPIRKIGVGTFIVPESMYENVPFNIDAGYIKYDYSGESVVTVKKQISGKGGLIKSGSGSVKFNVYNSFKGGTTIDEGTILLGDNDWALGDTDAQIRVNEGAALDVNGRNRFGYNLTLNGGSLKNTGSDAITNQVQFKSITLEADSVIDLAHTTAIINDNYSAATLNLNNHTLTKRGSADFFVCNVTVNAGTIKLEEGAIKVHNNACNFSAVDLVVAGTAQFNGNDAPTVFKTLTFDGNAAALTQPNGKMLTVSDTISGVGTIQNLTLQDGATVELGEEGVITVIGTLAFGDTLKIKGGAFDKAAFAFTTEPTALPSNVVLVNDEGTETTGYYFNLVNGKLVIASNEAKPISGVVTVSTDIPSWTTTRMKLTGDTVFVIDTAEGMPSSINFISDEAHNLAFVYAAPYEGTLTFSDNITVEKKYAPEAWRLVPTTIGPNDHVITIIGHDTEEDADAEGNDFSTAITVQEGGVLHLERLIKLSAANNVNQGGTLEIVEDTTPDAPATFAKVRMADRGMKGTLNIGKNTTYYPFGYADQPDYDNSTSIINVYGTLDMSDEITNYARWTLREGITVNFYVGSKAIGLGQQTTGEHNSAFQFNRAGCVLNFLKDGETGGEIVFDLRLRPQHVFTMNIEEGVIVKMGGDLNLNVADRQPFAVTGEGKVIITGTYEFGAPPEVAPEQLEIAEDGSMTIKSWIDYEFNGDLASIGTDTGTLNFDGSGFNTSNSYKTISDENKAVYTGVSAYRAVDQLASGSTSEWTAAIYGTFARLEDGSFIDFGNKNGGIALINGKENVVKVVKLAADAKYVTLFEVLIPEAHTKAHLYSLIRKSGSVELYVDGKLRGSYLGEVAINGGFQIGGVWGGVGNTGILKFRDAFNSVSNAVLLDSYVDVLRIYKSALGQYANQALAEEMGYMAPGVYTRELADNKNYSWEETGAWKKGEETFSKPAAYSEVELSVPDENVSATITITDKANVGSLTISGAGMLGIVAESDGTLVNYGDTIIEGVYASVKYGAADFTHGGIGVLNNGAIDFDFSGYNVNQIIERTVIPVTGITEKLDEEAISITTPGQLPSRTMTLEYNESVKRYEVVITIDREVGEVVWNDDGDIAYGKSVLADGVTSVLFPGDSLEIDREVSAANGVSGLDIRIAEGGSLKLTGGQNPGAIQVDEGGIYDVNGGAVVPTALKLKGGKFINSAVNEVQPLATTLNMMANSTIAGNVAFGALTLNGTGTLTIPEGLSIKFGAAVTKDSGSELNIDNSGTIYITSSAIPAIDSLLGAGIVDLAAITVNGAFNISGLVNDESTLIVHGITGSNSYFSNTTKIRGTMKLQGNFKLNNGNSGWVYQFATLTGEGEFNTQMGNPTVTVTIDTLIGNGVTLTTNSKAQTTVGNLVTDIYYGKPVIKSTTTDFITVTSVNGSAEIKTMKSTDGIYLVAATYADVDYKDVNEAINAALEAEGGNIDDIVVYDPNPTLTGDYIVKMVEGVLKVVPVEKSEITANTRVSTWTSYTTERLVVNGAAKEVTVTFDAAIPETIKEVRLEGNVKLVAEGNYVIETSKLKGMEGAMITIVSDIEGDFEVKSALKLDNVTLSHAVMTDQDVEITGVVSLAGIRASSIYAHDATLKTAEGVTHKFPESRAMKIAGTVVIDSTLEIAAGATLTINAESAATLKILKSKVGEGAVSLTENVTLYIPAGVQVLNVNGAGKVDGAGLISVKDFASTPAPVESWSGTYVLAFTGTGLASVNPNNYGNANSIVRMNGVNGWFVTNEAYLSTIELIDNGATPALTINNGSSGANLLFGKIIGGGTIATAGGSSQKSIVKDGSEFYGSITMTTTKSIVFGDTISGLNNNMIIVQNGYSTMIGAGKTWTAANGITINGTIKGSGTLGSATTFGSTSIIDISEGNLTLGAGVTLPEIINIKGAKNGSVVLAGIPAGTQVPKFNLVDASGSFELKLQSNGQLVLVGHEVTISIPDVDNTSYLVTANGKPLVVQNGSITVDSGTTITVTYTPEAGYVGGGSLTTTIVNGLTPIRSDLISVKKGVKVVIREYKGAKVRTISGLDEDGIATEKVTINGSDYSLDDAENGILIIEIKP